MKRIGKFLIALLVIAAVGVGTSHLFTHNYYYELEREIVKETNAYRAEFGLKPLKIDTKAARVAHQKAWEMYKRNYIAHESPSQGDLVAQFSSWGKIYMPEYATMIGENLVYFEGYTLQQLTPETIVQAWIDSPSHRANLLNEGYDAIGVAFAWGEDERGYAAQEFLQRAGQ